ncbi:MAG TPA: DUF4233 domain-containing protein [Jiangellaceae bacterium]|nr:DUF4233 domain-containing protein [Jiangellaceae bacterium]
MNRVAATLLVLEGIVVMLAIPVAVVVGDVEPAVAITVGVAIGVLCMVAAGLLRRGRPGYVLGSLLQVAAIATGFVVPAMFFLGGLFALLWVVVLRIGPEVDQARASGEG